MRLTDRILQAYLQDHFNIKMSYHIGRDVGFEGVLTLTGGDSVEADWIYVPESENTVLPDTPGIAALFVLSERYQGVLPENNAFILLEGEISFTTITNQISRCFRYYQQWENELMQIREMDAGIEEMLKISLPIFGNPLMLQRADMTSMVEAGCDELPDAYRVFRAGVENMDIINAILQDPQYHECKDRQSCYWGPDYILGYRTCNWNIIQAGVGTHCLVVMEYHQKIGEWVEDLLEILGRFVKNAIIHNESQGARQNDALHRLLIRILSDRTLDYVEASRQLADMGWNAEHEYMCLVLQQTYMNSSSLPANAICNHVEELFVHTASFSYDNSIVSFFNLTKLEMNKDDVSSRLSYFIRDTYLKAGYSRIMEGHLNLRRQYVQSILALDVGGRRQPYLWIHHFDQIAMTYIMEQITRRLPGSMLCHTGILRLKKMDEENGSEYIETLRTFLDHHQNIVHSAASLFIHRSTLIYRMDKIKEVLESDLEDPEELLYLELSLRLLDKE